MQQNIPCLFVTPFDGKGEFIDGVGCLTCAAAGCNELPLKGISCWSILEVSSTVLGSPSPSGSTVWYITAGVQAV